MYRSRFFLSRHFAARYFESNPPGGGTIYNETIRLGISAGMSLSPAAASTHTIALGISAGISATPSLLAATAISLGSALSASCAALMNCATSITLGIINSLQVTDADATPASSSRLKRWLSWPPFPWRQWFIK